MLKNMEPGGEKLESVESIVEAAAAPAACLKSASPPENDGVEPALKNNFDLVLPHKKFTLRWLIAGLFLVPLAVFCTVNYLGYSLYAQGLHYYNAGDGAVAMYWGDAEIFQPGLAVEYALVLPLIVYGAMCMQQVNRALALRYQQKAPLASWQIAGISLLSVVCLPVFLSAFQQVTCWIDPSFWFWVFCQFAFFWSAGAFLERQEDPKLRYPWKVPLLLSCAVNAYLFAGLVVPDLINLLSWSCSQAFGLLFLLYVAFRKRPVQGESGRQRPSVDSVQKNAGDIIVPYHAFAGLEEWTKQRFKSGRRSQICKLILIWFALPLLFLTCTVSSPLTESFNTMVARITGRAPRDIENPGFTASMTPAQRLKVLKGIEEGKQFSTDGWTQERGEQNLFLLKMLLWGMAVSAGSLSLYYLRKPNRIAFGGRGIRFLRRGALANFDGPETGWDDVTYITIKRPPGKNSPVFDVLVFDCAGKRQIQVPLKCVDSVESKEAILEAIQTFAPLSLKRHARVLEALQPPADYSYTELWLQALSAPPQRERLKPLKRGAVLQDGRLSVIESLGVGGQGQAYLAADKQTGDNVVLKEFLLPVYVDVDVRKTALVQFENEARILSQLSHAQVVKLLDFFVEDHRAYLVLEHVPGSTLRQLVSAGGCLSEGRVSELARQMCEILAYLHGLAPPVVHRDFTPDNLILQPDGLLKLIDFNVAKQLESTTMGSVVGKHAYLPPEQFRGQPVTASDIYAMGATLYYLLTGQDPEAVSASHPRQVNPQVSEGMEYIVATATAPELAVRYKNVDEMAADLARLV
jgi:tRNA A-37 threonylcarbamoyl transferase component Bud32